MDSFSVVTVTGRMDETIELSRRYGEILGGNLEMDVRLVDPEEEAA